MSRRGGRLSAAADGRRLTACASPRGIRSWFTDAVTTALFVIPLWLDLTAVAIGAIQGAMFAARLTERRIDLLGVALIGVIVGLGGGLMRDILLNQLPAAISDNWYIPVATAAALIGMLLLRVFTRLNGLIIALDAVTIGLFGAIGTSKALAYGVPVVPAVFIGVLAAVGGSILRDVALNLPIALMHVGSLYAIAATAGTVLLVVLVAFGVNIVVAASACVVVTTITRLGSVRFGWSLPEQRALGSWKVWRRA
jgi:uncharacterized membrane protein YeiH